jgi:hypothetical protein
LHQLVIILVVFDFFNYINQLLVFSRPLNKNDFYVPYTQRFNFGICCLHGDPCSPFIVALIPIAASQTSEAKMITYVHRALEIG